MCARTVTVVFTDLVASTATLSALEPAEAERVRGAHLALVSQTLEAFGGAVVKSLGDGVMAAFEGAGPALGAAAAIQRAVSSHRPLPAIALAMRIGISAGDATPSGDGDWHGHTVVEASRLCAIAEPGQVVLAEVVARLAGERPHRFEDLGGLRLKGLVTPVRALELCWRVTEGAPLRVSLADDSALVREGIARLLEGAAIDVVSRTGDGDSLIADARRLRPDVVVTDVRMPPGNSLGGLLAAEAIRREDPTVGVLLLSTEVEQHIAARLLATGSDGVGYLSKDRVGDLEQFIEAIRTVAAGGCVLDASLARSGW